MIFNDPGKSWMAIAIAVGVVAIALGVALAIVASIRGSDTLATTALAVAIVAFAAQLIIALAQVLSDSQQARRNEEVMTQAREALAELKGLEAGMLTTINEHYSQLFAAFVRQGDSDTPSVPSDVEEGAFASTAETSSDLAEGQEETQEDEDA